MSDALSNDGLKLINAVFSGDVNLPAKYAKIVLEVQEWSKKEHKERESKDGN